MTLPTSKKVNGVAVAPSSSSTNSSSKSEEKNGGEDTGELTNGEFDGVQRLILILLMAPVTKIFTFLTKLFVFCDHE